MPTKNPRINITFEEATAQVITSLAKQQRKSVSHLAKELIIEALDRREDMILSAVAEARDIDNAKRVKHDNVWKKAV